jgi:Flp pilus assembly protein TadD/glutathione synthase/RimK-type ligase-like ATP-grasp enzyme
MKANRNRAHRPATAASEWAPRLALEARLTELDALLALAPEDSIPLEVERAALLGGLNRRQEAQQAFVSILKRAPTHFSALNEFGTLLTHMGAIDAACRVYAEAILHHPDNPMARVNLANLLLRATRYEEARGHYERALQADPDHAAAHQGMGAVLADLGDRDGARVHFRKGFGGHAVSTLPYRGNRPPIRLLQLVSSGGGNIPSSLFLDDTGFQTTVVVTDYLDDATPLPPHQLIFNAIGDADLCEVALKAATRIAASARVPVINDPRAVMKTGRIENAKRLAELPGVRTARTAAFSREALAGADGVQLLAGQGFAFPLLLRSPGYHTGRNFILVEAAADLATAAQGLPGEELLAIEYLDARGRDGQARKFRVMMIGGRLYPLHLAISRNWKVHYFTADMAEHADYREEEAKFLEDMPAVLGAKAIRALKEIQSTLGLDYAGVDFGLSPAGDLLLFETNATMVIARPRDDPRWTYRRAAIDGAIEAVVAMLKRRAAARAR